MRLIARIDVKNEHVIKGIHLEGLRKLGNPNEFALDYYEQGIDEIIFMDAVASLYDRNNLFDIILKACQNVFVPITLGGGLRTISDIELALKSGVDKVAINTGAIKDPNFIKTASRVFGSQCIVGSIEAKRSDGSWEAFVDNGRERTSRDVIDWAKELEDLGIGELMITSVDQEGTKKGFDLELLRRIQESVACPVILSGGLGKLEDIDKTIKVTEPSAIASASVLHYKLQSISEVKEHMSKLGLEVRPCQ